MGKKVNPKVLRLGITKTWPSRWFEVGKDYIKNTKQDVLIRKYLLKKFIEAGVDRVEIERGANKITIIIYTGKPGLLIGRGGTGVEDLKREIHTKFLRAYDVRLNEINLNINEFDRPNLSAQILVQQMILDVQKRLPFRRIMKQAISRVERAGALGIKIVIGGRLNGAEIARTEKLVSGKLPLQTLRADIDYARGVAHTTYGCIGIKVWIYKGEIFEKEKVEEKGQILGKKK